MRPTLAEIEATVDRLEARLAQSPDPATRNLLSTYHKLDARFRTDLTDARDLALSRGAALMLVKFLDESQAGEAAR